MKKIFLAAAFAISIAPVFSQAQKTPPAPAAPKLVVGIVVDQMRYDYIYKYWSKFGNDGFKKLVGEGFSCKNANYNYVPTYTGPGHASIYTGTTPAVHGIVANEWYAGVPGREMYCAEDSKVETVGSTSIAGKMSPRNMLSTTIGDELRLSNGKKSKVIGIALKDRGAILPAGHTANAAYWFDGATGNWISSTFYMKELPQWVTDFNKKERAKKYLSQKWTTLLPIDQYTESSVDESPYERVMQGETAPVFPHDLTVWMANQGMGAIKSTPFGNTLTKEFALDAIKAENLGKGSVTDMITISFSSTDYVGHYYGTNAIELEDTYIRLDQEIAELLKFLDLWVGKNNSLVFLTADHGAVEVPQYLMDSRVPAGYMNPWGVVDSLKRAFAKEYGDTLILAYTNHNIYLNRKLIAQKGLSMELIENKVAGAMLDVKGVAGAVTGTALGSTQFTEGIRYRIQKGYYSKRAGDVIIFADPAWVEYERTGTTHGTPYPYDTHVPLLWYGWNIKSGNSSQAVSITDIAPTIAAMLNIPFPDGCTGQPIPFLVK